MTEKQDIIKCPFCPCMFCNHDDLRKHLLTMVIVPRPANVPPINERDHQNKFKQIHYKLENNWENE